MNSDFPLVTLTTMLGPSPDWFVGVSGLPLRENGTWLSPVVVDLHPYDGGTRSDNVWKLFGAENDPPEPITVITEEGGQLVGPGRLGTFTFTLVPDPNTAVVERSDSQPGDFALAQSFPNPFNSGTVIRFSLPVPTDVLLSVYNLAGQQVSTLAQGRRQAGTYTLGWDGRDDGGRALASGVYIYRLQAGHEVESRRLLLLR